jgi:hypothetical protein
VNTENLHVIYISQLAPGQNCAVFSAICRVARSRNTDLGIAGVLLFDGERFLQWLHGARDPVSQLMNAIVADTRHTGVRVLLEVPLGTASVDPRWRTGFIDADALDAVAALDPADHGAIFDALARLLAQADLDPVPQIAVPPASSAAP